MMDELRAVYAITKQLEEALNRINDSDIDRAELIQQVNELIEQRETMIQQLSKPYSKEEMEVGKQIISMNNQIKDKMDVLYKTVKEDMKQVQKRKTQNYSYLNPYGNLKTPDGMYMDDKL